MRLKRLLHSHFTAHREPELAVLMLVRMELIRSRPAGLGAKAHYLLAWTIKDHLCSGLVVLVGVRAKHNS